VGILEIRRLSKRFGGLTALHDLSFDVEEGEIRGLIGPNGAGKTTIFNLISGFYRPSDGAIHYRGQTISGLSSSQIARLGIIRTFQHTTLFQELTVIQNVLVGRHLLARSNILAAILGLDRRRIIDAEDRALAILDFFGLADRRHETAANLPHGLQKTLGLAVALAAEPKLLLLDEPFAGMNPEETMTMMRLVRQVRNRGITVLLVEHDMQAVMGLCDRITVVNFGELLAEGSPAEIRAHPEVIEAYLGTA
jgi:ABC-type branched-subunit amino acid transport system ATPase component